jgi:hypothetical protein
LNGAETDAEPFGDGAHRRAVTNGADDCDAARRSDVRVAGIFCSWIGRRQGVFQECTDLGLLALE